MKRRILIYGGAFALYVALMAVTWSVGTRQAEAKTEAMLDYAVSDIHVTLDGVIDTMLEHLASAVARRFGRPAAYGVGEVAAAAAELDIDELNIVGADNKIVASNVGENRGFDMSAKPETRPFGELLAGGAARTVSQPFRRNAYGDSRRKYLGVPFPEGAGYVQVGLDEARMETMISRQFAFLFDAEMEDTVCYLCASLKTGNIVSAKLEDGMAKTLADIGFAAAPAAAAGAERPDAKWDAPGETFRETLYGRTAFCRSFLFGGHRFIIIEPEDEFYGARNLIAATMAALLFLVLGGFAFFTAKTLDDSDRIREFHAARDAALAKDMEIAKTIQSSALPSPLAPSPYFRISASMTPARDVGGDFYDFFVLDPTHVAFLVADVSGKGITAALYMMTAKTVIKNALLALRDPAAAFTKANGELCRNNSANMFLTAWAGVLDLESGEVAFANAGHNPPVLLSSGAPAFQTSKSGPMLAFVDGVEYKPRKARLDPGDALFLYTDGVTEATDPQNELFGEARLEATLGAATAEKPESVCTLVRAAVAAFAAGSPAADDLTVLAVEYVSRPNRFVRSFPPSQDGVAQASDFLDETMRSFQPPAPPKFLSSLHVVVDEIASNIVKHSGASGFEVDVEFLGDPKGVKLAFIDDGTPYDPLSHADPDTSLPAEERAIGGLGILMVKKMSDSVSYERTRNRNFLYVFCRSAKTTAPA